MTALSVETFTGAEDTDIEGRTPDGGESPVYGVGVWDRVQSTGNGRLAIGSHLDLWRYLRPARLHVAADNAASLTLVSGTNTPVGLAVGDLILVEAYSRNGLARAGDLPLGYTLLKHLPNGASSGDLQVYWKIAEADDLTDNLTVTFSGGGAVGTTVLLSMWAFTGIDTASPIDVIGAESTWGSADNLGPVTGITPSQAGSLVLLFAAKQNEWEDDEEVGAGNAFTGFALGGDAVTVGGLHHGEAPESSLGDRAGMCLMWHVQAEPVLVPDTTVIDGGSGRPGAGCGFMASVKLAGIPDVTGRCRQRGTSLGDPVAPSDYVVTGITGLGTDYAVEAHAVIWTDYTNWVRVLARHSASAETGYELRLTPGSTNNLLGLWHRNAGVQTRMAPDVTIPRLPYGTEQVLRLCVSGSSPVRLRGWLDGVEHFDVSTSTLLHASGEPGLGFADASPAGDGLGAQVNRWWVGDDCCAGGPDNPFPGDPPPTDADEEGGLHVMDQLTWDEAQIPEAETGVRVFDQLAADEEILEVYVADNLLWRKVIVGEPDEFDPPPDTPLPPHFDPCRLMPPLPPTGVTPNPLTGRMFGLASMPTTMIGDLFNGNSMPIGAWSPSECAAAFTRGGMILKGQGSYQHFRDGNGHYSRAIYMARIGAILTPIAAQLEVAHNNGSLFGFSVADDFAGGTHWPPSGLTEAEVGILATFVRGICPFMRLGVRGRPTQFNTNPGLDFMTCAYRYWGNPSPAVWHATELAQANSIGLPFVLWALNTSKGNTNRTEMTAAQVIEAGTVLASDAGGPTYGQNAGIINWHYDPPTWDQIPGILDAFATVRNVLALLPPP